MTTAPVYFSISSSKANLQTFFSNFWAAFIGLFVTFSTCIFFYLYVFFFLHLYLIYIICTSLSFILSTQALAQYAFLLPGCFFFARHAFLDVKYFDQVVKSKAILTFCYLFFFRFGMSGRVKLSQNSEVILKRCPSVVIWRIGPNVHSDHCKSWPIAGHTD